VADAHDQHEKLGTSDLVKDSIITDPDSIESFLSGELLRTGGCGSDFSG
jgi:hypothetical protein